MALEKTEIAVEGIATVGEVTVLPIVRTYVVVRRAGSGVMCSASKCPLGVVIVSPQGRRALNIAGEDVPVEDYVAMAPALRDLL